MKVLGFDIGITSVGWAYIEDDVLKGCGVRIFTKAENPKSGDSLAAPRRDAERKEEAGAQKDEAVCVKKADLQRVWFEAWRLPCTRWRAAKGL